MIKVEIENYCQNCPYFEADVNGEPYEDLSTFWCQYDATFKLPNHNTTIRCANRTICDYVARVIKAESNNND